MILKKMVQLRKRDSLLNRETFKKWKEYHNQCHTTNIHKA